MNERAVYNDHDFPLGYKIIPCGKMPLLKKGTDLQEVFGDFKDIDIDSPPKIFNRHELHEETVEVDEDLGFDVDRCVVDTPKVGEILISI